MGGMMGATTGAMYLWIALWTVLGLALIATCGVVVARMLGGHRRNEHQIAPGGSPALEDAKAALRLRYARGEISREEFLQGKVELED
jgi:putative membrane protein